jgi:sulfite exporter TauE/SafE
MGLGTSLFMIALGAILRFAVNVTTQGFNIHAVGVILMVLGLVGLLLSALWMTMWADQRRGVATVERRDAVVVRDHDHPL